MDHEYKKYSQMFQKAARVIKNLNDYPTKHHSKQHSNEYRIHLYITNKKNDRTKTIQGCVR